MKPSATSTACRSIQAWEVWALQWRSPVSSLSSRNAPRSASRVSWPTTPVNTIGDTARVGCRPCRRLRSRCTSTPEYRAWPMLSHSRSWVRRIRASASAPRSVWWWRTVEVKLPSSSSLSSNTGRRWDRVRVMGSSSAPESRRRRCRTGRQHRRRGHAVPPGLLLEPVPHLGPDAQGVFGEAGVGHRVGRGGERQGAAQREGGEPVLPVGAVVLVPPGVLQQRDVVLVVLDWPGKRRAPVGSPVEVVEASHDGEPAAHVECDQVPADVQHAAVAEPAHLEREQRESLRVVQVVESRSRTSLGPDGS
ncbi:hypothetical protein SGLAM104S_05309 [Streptomyces glaucescens]